MGRSWRGTPPAEVVRARAEVEAWRGSRKKWSRMPVELWELAGRLANAHGINPVAQALELKHASVKAHAEAVRGRGVSPGFAEATASPPKTERVGRASEMSRPATFVELKAPVGPDPGKRAATALGVIVVEVRAADGSTLSIQVSAGASLDVGELVRAFRGDAR